MIAIVDSSVAVKWYAPEEDSDLALTLLFRQIGAPDLLLAEVGNAVSKKVRRGQMTVEQTLTIIPHLVASVTLMPAAPLAERALSMSLELHHPTYDCFFLALARQLDLPLVTADERFAAKVKSAFAVGAIVALRDWRSS